MTAKRNTNKPENILLTRSFMGTSSTARSASGQFVAKSSLSARPPTPSTIGGAKPRTWPGSTFCTLVMLSNVKGSVVRGSAYAGPLCCANCFLCFNPRRFEIPPRKAEAQSFCLCHRDNILFTFSITDDNPVVLLIEWQMINLLAGSTGYVAFNHRVVCFERQSFDSNGQGVGNFFSFGGKVSCGRKDGIHVSRMGLAEVNDCSEKLEDMFLPNDLLLAPALCLDDLCPPIAGTNEVAPKVLKNHDRALVCDPPTFRLVEITNIALIQSPNLPIALSSRDV